VPRDTMNGTLLYIFCSCILLNINSSFMCPMICALQPYSTAESGIYKASCGYLIHFYIVLNMYLHFCILLHCFAEQSSWDTDNHQAGKNSSVFYGNQNFLRVLSQLVAAHILTSCLISVLILSSFLCLGLPSYLFPSNFRAETLSALSHTCSYVVILSWGIPVVCVPIR
jgi:hypothetical protein